jgi:hypothetical protein
MSAIRQITQENVTLKNFNFWSLWKHLLQALCDGGDAAVAVDNHVECLFEFFLFFLILTNLVAETDPENLVMLLWVYHVSVF